MARTDAQQKAHEAGQKKIAEARKIISGGSSGGFSSADPKKARGTQTDAATYTKIYGGGSSSVQSPAQDGFSSADPTLANGSQVAAKVIQPAKIIKTDTTYGAIDLYKDRYTKSLSEAPKTNLTVQAYSGVILPYGQKDVKWYEPQFGTAVKDFDKVTYEGDIIEAKEYTGMKEVSLIETLKEQEVVDPDISKPTSQIVRQSQEKIIKDIKKEEIDKANKIMDDSIKDIQARIDSGEITLEEGEKSLSNISEITNRKLNSIVKEKVMAEIGIVFSSKELNAKVSASQKFRGTFDKAFSKEYKETSNWGKAELTADIGAGVLSGVVPPLGIAYFAGKGFYKAAKGAEKDIRMIDVAPSGELITPRYMGLIPSEQSREAGVSLLFAGVSGLGYVSKIGADITALRKAEIIAKPWSVTSKELGKQGDKTLLSIRGSKVIHGASAEGKSIFQVKVGEKGAFNILGGKGEVNLRVVDFMKQGVVKSGDDILSSSVKYSTFGRGVFTSKAYPNMKLFITQGEGYITPNTWQNVKLVGKKSKFWSEMLGRPFGDTYVKGTYVGDKVSLFDFGGISRKVGEKTFFTSGRFTGAKLNLKTLGITGKFNPEVWGSTLVKSGDDVIYKGFKSFGGAGGKKSSSKFLSDMFKPSTVTTTQQVQSATKAEAALVGSQFGGQTFTAAQNLAIQILKTAPLISPQAVTLPALVITSLVESKQIPKTAIIPKTDVKIDSTSKSITSLLPLTSPYVSTAVGQEFISKTKQSPGIKQISEQVTKVTTSFVMPASGLLGGGAGTFGLNFRLPIYGKTKSIMMGPKKFTKGFIPQVMHKGKWKTVGGSMSRQSALSRASDGADNTTSRRMRIIPTSKKPSKQVIGGWGIRSHKFRPYKIKKGRKIKLPNSFIERTSNAIDSVGEKRGLSIAKYSKAKGWIKNTIKNKGTTKSKRRSDWLF